MSGLLLNIKGVSCAAVNAGIKNNDELDLSVISLIEGSETAAVFTQNIFCAAPVAWLQKIICKTILGLC